jgi:hypothetical protein
VFPILRSGIKRAFLESPSVIKASKALVTQLKGDVMTDSKAWENGGPKMDRRGALECKRLGGNRLLCGSRVGRADNL